jgi:hypothetical protein
MIDDIQQNDEGDDSATSPSANVPSEEQKREITRWVADGMGLSELQKKLDSEFGIVMTYMDVRFLVDDLDLSLVDLEEPATNKDEAETAEDISADLDETKSVGGVQLEVDTVVPPGAMASGSVVFSDGVSKSWTIDQFGRLGLSGGQEGYKPSDEDLMEFQRQLESSLRNKGI